jgi:ABC-type branched-subunit amino acid transport system ATPase component
VADESATFFRVDGLAKHFGGVHAVEDMSFTLAQGEIVGLIGPNGSGKTTTINMVTGALKPNDGAIRFNGAEMAGAAAHVFARRGIARTFQVPRLFRRMSVMENLVVPALSDPAERRSAAEERGRGVLAFLKLGHLADDYARALSGGQQKLLELGRALMLRPRLLLLDEPFAGVHPRLLEQIIEHIRSLNRDGLTIVVVDHNLEAIQSVVTRVMVMARGRKIADGEVAQVLQNPDVVRAYTGTRAAQ